MATALNLRPYPQQTAAPRPVCPDCGARLDPWNCCPQVPADVARVSSSRQQPLFCGLPPVPVDWLAPILADFRKAGRR